MSGKLTSFSPDLSINGLVPAVIKSYYNFALFLTKQILHTTKDGCTKFSSKNFAKAEF